MLAHFLLIALLMPQQRVMSADQTDTLRAAFSRALQRGDLRDAQRLAHAYAVAWHDPFLVGEAARYAAATPARRRARIEADSLRKAGTIAFTSAGVPAAMRLWRASLQSAVMARDSVAQAAALGNLGAGFYRAGQLADAETYLTRARSMATAMGDMRTTAVAIGVLASVYRDRGELAKAAEHYALASRLRQRVGDSRGVAADQNNQGLVARDLGDLAGAKTVFQSALAINRQAGRAGPASINLLNLAGIASLLGDYAQADTWFTEVLSLQRSNGDAAETGFTLHDRGLLRMRRGDYDAAMVDLRAAIHAHETAGAPLDAASTARDLASLLLAMGEPQQAIVTLRKAEAAARAAGAPPATLGDFAFTRGDVALELNSFEEANEYYTNAQQLYLKAGDDFGLGKTADARGVLMSIRGNHAEAVSALTAASRAYARAGDARAAALSQITQAYAQMELADLRGAGKSITEARRSLHSLGDTVGEAAALKAWGDLAMAHHTPVRADSAYRDALNILGDRQAADLRWRLHAARAAALAAQNSRPAALQQLRATVNEIERSSGTLVSPERRAGFLADKLDVYGELALAERARGDVAAAFAATERMRSQQMLALMSHARVATPRASIKEEQDLRRQIADLMKLLGAPVNEVTASRESNNRNRSNAAVRESLFRAQTRYTRLLTELREKQPGYSDVINPVPTTVTAITRQLRRNEVMIDYVVTDSTTLVFVITDRGASLIDLNISQRALAPLIDFAVRVTQRAAPRGSAVLWQAPLTRLYDDLITPLETSGLLHGKQSLIIVPHAELHFLPFAALVNRRTGKFLVNSWDITYAPSASVWLRLRQNAAKRASGVLALAPREDALPFSTLEVNRIKHIYGRNATVLSGTAASKAALRAGIPNVGVVHLATLGILNKHNPLFSFVDLGSRSGRPQRLEVHEAFDLALHGQLVVLSACQTGLGSGALADVPPGDDWTGLVQAFLSAGAGAVVASLWSVNDRATAELMTRFHQGIKSGHGDARALADAQRAALADPNTMQPFYWAAFTVNSGRAN